MKTFATVIGILGIVTCLLSENWLAAMWAAAWTNLVIRQ